MEVNKENMRLFIEALRSGEFRQGLSTLAGKKARDEHWKYCCLGVACEIAIRNGAVVQVREEEITYGDHVDRFYRLYEGTSTVLPAPVREWLGLIADEADPQLLTGFDNMHKLHATNLNDNYGWTFEQIADAFERTFLKENNENNSDPA